VVSSRTARASNSVTRKEELVFKRRFNVARAIPVRSAASRWVIPDVVKASEITLEMSLGCCRKVCTWSNIVPTWDSYKPTRSACRKFLYHCGDSRYLRWVYRLSMAENKRDPNRWSVMCAAQVRAERAAASWTQEQMWTHAHLSRSTYLRIESGEHVLDTAELAQICGALNLSMSEFFHRVEQRFDKKHP
jgi:DNA-binding XRE family transcriptional regulator